MPRIRTIQPHFSRSLSMVRISREARFLFVLLWTVVDDVGRCHADPDDLAKVLYPQDADVPHQIWRWLDELEDEGCVERYEVDDIDYLRIVHWQKHQRICHPTKSYLPPPPREALTGERAAPLDDARIREVSRKVAGRDRKIPRDQALEEESDMIREIDEDFQRKLAELASGDLTPEALMEYLHLGLNRSLAADVHTAPARYIDLAGRHHRMWNGNAAPADKKEQPVPEERSISPAAFHGLPDVDRR
jgi:hypothetical protein